MIFDVHTYVGHFPFRPIRHNTPETLHAYLQAAGVDRALVANLNAVFYRDVNAGNLELHQWLEDAPPTVRAAFVKACVVNPAYPAWRQDACRCVREMGFSALQLYPAYHGYALDGAEGLTALDLAAQLGVPVHLPRAIEDIRQKHPLDAGRNLTVAETASALAKATDADVILSNGPSLDMAQAIRDTARRGRVLYDFNRLEVFSGVLGRLLEVAGEDNVVFGSLAPLQYIDHQLVKLEFLQADDRVKRKIAETNLQALFRA